MYYLAKVQSNIHNDSTHSLFSLDLFMFCIVVVSGCVSFITNGMSMSNRIEWLNKFPEALWMLSKRSSWDAHMPRVIQQIIMQIN